MRHEIIGWGNDLLQVDVLLSMDAFRRGFLKGMEVSSDAFRVCFSIGVCEEGFSTGLELALCNMGSILLSDGMSIMGVFIFGLDTDGSDSSESEVGVISKDSNIFGFFLYGFGLVNTAFLMEPVFSCCT